MVLKSSAALNNSGRITAMKYGISRGKASYPWGKSDLTEQHLKTLFPKSHTFSRQTPCEFPRKASRRACSLPQMTLNGMRRTFFGVFRYIFHDINTHYTRHSLQMFQNWLWFENIAPGRSVKVLTKCPRWNPILRSSTSYLLFLSEPGGGLHL